MYQSELLDAYKKAQNYVQDKQIAHDLNLPSQRISEMRKGTRYISDTEAVFLAENSGIDPELALLGIHADRNDNPSIKALWERMAKKYNRLGLQGLSMAVGSLALYATEVKASLLQPPPCVIMYNPWVHITFGNNTPFRSIDSEVSRDDQELHFS
ncbi:DUF3693 domain-containing protein [Vibrio fluvialis]|nr:DUF3693 domain-containing protein [Vibrio fluvialis]MCG6365044.1 DUF3693 domain-containing protein [Vibrio fluvialis]